jgi:hypothetical protein
VLGLPRSGASVFAWAKLAEFVVGLASCPRRREHTIIVWRNCGEIVVFDVGSPGSRVLGFAHSQPIVSGGKVGDYAPTNRAIDAIISQP